MNSRISQYFLRALFVGFIMNSPLIAVILAHRMFIQQILLNKWRTMRLYFSEQRALSN